MKKKIGFLIVIVAVGAASTTWAVSSLTAPEPVEQPIAFNHNKHMTNLADLELENTCLFCHKGANDGRYATFPKIKLCLSCHNSPQGENPSEPKIREFAEAKREIPWKQVNHLPGHVYFSHTAHVKYAGMDCADCHGDMTARSEPVTLPQIGQLTMSRCMRCHEEKRAPNQCTTCHQ